MNDSADLKEFGLSLIQEQIPLWRKFQRKQGKMETTPELPKLLVEKYLQGIIFNLGSQDNFEYIMLNANCCGEYIREESLSMSR